MSLERRARCCALFISGILQLSGGARRGGDLDGTRPDCKGEGQIFRPNFDVMIQAAAQRRSGAKLSCSALSGLHSMRSAMIRAVIGASRMPFL